METVTFKNVYLMKVDQGYGSTIFAVLYFDVEYRNLQEPFSTF